MFQDVKHRTTCNLHIQGGSMIRSTQGKITAANWFVHHFLIPQLNNFISCNEISNESISNFNKTILRNLSPGGNKDQPNPLERPPSIACVPILPTVQMPPGHSSSLSDLPPPVDIVAADINVCYQCSLPFNGNSLPTVCCLCSRI